MKTVQAKDGELFKTAIFVVMFIWWERIKLRHFSSLISIMKSICHKVLKQFYHGGTVSQIVLNTTFKSRFHQTDVTCTCAINFQYNFTQRCNKVVLNIKLNILTFSLIIWNQNSSKLTTFILSNHQNWNHPPYML